MLVKFQFLFNKKRGGGPQRAQLFCGNGLCGIQWVTNFFSVGKDILIFQE